MKTTRKTKILILGLLLGLLAARAALGATFTVTTTNDTGAGSLRQAILDANATDGLDTITFAIDTNLPPAVHTITPASALPAIADPVTIDGYTQPGSSSNTLANAENAVLLIEISGAAIVGGDIGFRLSGVGGSTLRGLVINNGWSKGVSIQTTNVVIEGCFIGTDPTGLVARPVGTGMFAEFNLDTSSSRIGGTLPGQRNVISGGNPGIFFQSGTNHLVQGNFLGTDATGTNSLASGTGISLQFSSGNLIGGTNAAARNVIVAASGYGINLSSSTGNRIQGNFIGTDVTGTKAFGSAGTGIQVDSSTATQIGGVTGTRGAPPGNVIRSPGTGIYLPSGSSGTVIQGNLIGTDATGFKPLGSGLDGIELFSSFNVVSNNVIAANGLRGIFITESHDNLVQDNFIGTDITGTNFLGNASDGVLAYGCFSNTIRANVIAGNRGAGVNLYAPFGSVSNISVLGNSIFANGGLGIDLVSGANNSQTNPVLTNVLSGSNTVLIQGVLSSMPNTTYRLEFFANTRCDPSGFGEGETFLGAANVTTDATGTNRFSATLPPLGICLFVATATATDPNGNTSEFSKCIQSVGIDGDGDTECDIEEILAGTDPHDSGSFFHITQLTREGDDLRVTWTCGAGRTNMLQAAGRPDGSLIRNFVDLPPAVVLSGVGVVTTNRLDVGAGTNTARYYRVRLVQ